MGTDPVTLGVMVSSLFFLWFIFFLVWWIMCAFIWSGY